MNSLIGKGDKKLFVDKYGPPDKQAALDGGDDVWEYRLNEQKFTSPTGYRFATLIFFDSHLKVGNFRDGQRHLK